jgi:Stage II sporulation protein E (SpoIIE)
MGLTILAFLSIPGFIAVFALALRRGAGLPGRGIVAAVSAVLAVYALLQGLVYIFTEPGFPQSDALSLERMSGALLVVTHALLFLFVLEFPKPLPTVLRRFAWIVVVPVVFVTAYDAASSFDYLVSVYKPWETIFRIEGRYYNLFVYGDAAVAGLAAAILVIRALASNNGVRRQKSAVAAAFIFVGAGLILASTGLFSAGEAKRPIYVLAPLAALIITVGVYYAFRLSRLFDWRTIGRTLLGYAALFGVVGIPAGAATAALIALGNATSPFLAVAGSIPVFVAAAYMGRLFFARFFSRLSARGDYREKLESGLAHIDLSLGRDAVLAEAYALLSKALDFKDFCILIDDDQGFMRTVFAPTGVRATVDRSSKLSELLETGESHVILKTDAETDVAFADERGPLLELFESLKAEAVIVVLEGRKAIGLISFGARSTGAEYTAYDYDSFRVIYGKLFVLAYYLKNIARESVMTTVDREIALSDQIIRFALEKVDRINHPKVDAAWIAKSARSLGGDFIDFVRLSQDRWFVVMGDVSGKGLSASMNMLILKSMIRTFLRVEKDFVALVARVNAFIKDNLPKGTFFAGVFGYLDLSKDAFFYINCGVPTIMLYSPAFDTFIEVQGEGRILGFVKDVAPYLKPRRLALTQGSVLIASTDGLLDSENLRGERFGKERLRRSVHERLGLTAAEISSGAMGDLLAFTDKRQDDDVTLFVMKHNSPARDAAGQSEPRSAK